MLKSFLFLTLSMAAMSVSCAPAAVVDFQPQIKTASPKEVIEIIDPSCVIPLPTPIKADTYFVFQELYDIQLIKNTLLVCDDKPHGTHPTPILACGQIKAIDGNLDGLPEECDCPEEDDPIKVKIQGRYKGKEVNYVHTFPNPCTFKAITKPVKEFVSIGLGLN